MCRRSGLLLICRLPAGGADRKIWHEYLPKVWVVIRIIWIYVVHVRYLLNPKNYQVIIHYKYFNTYIHTYIQHLQTQYNLFKEYVHPRFLFCCCRLARIPLEHYRPPVQKRYPPASSYWPARHWLPPLQWHLQLPD